MGRPYKNIQGDKYNRLYVICENGRDKHGSVLWLCMCDCGKYTTTTYNSLVRTDKPTKSCGCLNREQRIKNLPDDVSGENNPRWIDGRSKENWYHYANTKRCKLQRKNQTPILTEQEKAKIEIYYRVSQYLGEEWHVDHIIPLSKGGLHHPDNLQVVTKEYNLQKSNNLNFREPKQLEYWRI